MKEETEQKSLPASQKKLRDARRKAQVSRSRDFVSGVTLLVIIIYLLMFWPTIRDRTFQLADTVATIAENPSAEPRQQVIELATKSLLLTIMPPLFLIVAASVVAGMAGTLGPVFSFEPVTPRFDNINPVQGLKRIFSLRNVVEFAKAVFKVVVLAGAFWLVLRSFLQPLFEIPVCGEFCLAPMLVSALRPLALTAALVFLAVGILDILVQYRLFLRDMRMTKTEYKREQRELQGDPLIRGERRRVSAQLTTGPTRIGLHSATLAVSHGETIVGVRFRRNETPAPVVVSKARGERGAAMQVEARSLGIPIFEDAELAEALARHGVGEFVQTKLFQQIANLLVQVGFT
jgi:type III secretion protein U